MDDLIERLRALSRHEHSDYSIGDEAAAALEAAREDGADAARYRWLKANDNAYLLAEDVIDDKIAIDQARGTGVAE